MKIALLTCEKLTHLNPEDQPLIPALAQHGITAIPTIWSDKTIDWTTFDYLIFRNTWDYFEKESEFRAWLDHIEQLGIKTLNSIELVKQNIHKFYLRDLEQQGVTILPTVFIDRTANIDLSALLPASWKQAVIKPAFSAGSYLTTVFDAADVNNISEEYSNIATQKELLLQEFRPEIQTIGETSFIFFNKQFSHAVNKKPVDGDFRVQTLFGGKYTLVHPSENLIESAQKIIANFPDPLLYARVDGIIINDQLQLMEVECIEPDLYFNLSATALSQFVAALVKLIA
ncbi:hypothetical protein L1S34_06000 [Flavobacterium sp. K77]|uniref:ATP-grasp domain-containing protein n=1 Tax=Flavobacterium sp. K77 TaxID=2910676 RepID=UPI001F417896|nr:hypothetical protein [Flavobacterium sp. K77]MCF6140833.1 hypothetical protein [Flavobacterium sp. K77]